MDTQNTSADSRGNVSEDSIGIMDIVRLCLRKWYWFVISAGVCLAIGMLNILKTIPVYERSSTILVKEQLSRRTSANDLESMISSAGAGGTTSRLVNEVIAFKSPALMTDVISRLGLETEYSYDGRFHPTVIYGAKVPVSVIFCGEPRNVAASFQLSPSKDGFTLSKLVYADPAKGKKVKTKSVTPAAFGDTLDIKVGKIVVLPSELFTDEWTKPVNVTRRTTYGATRKFSSELSATQLDVKNRSDVLELRISDVNIQRADDILSMLMNVYNENWVDDKNKMAISTSMFINDRLKVIEKELGSVDENISEYKSKNLLPDVGAVSSMYMSRSSETARQIQELDNQLYVTRFVRNYLSNSTDNKQLIPMASSIQHAGIASQISEYNSVVLKRNSIVSNSSESNPLALNLAESLESMRKAIVEAIDNQVKTLEVQMQALQKEDEKTNKRIAASPSQAKYLLSVERQQKVKESLYLFLLQKREENELSQAFTAYNTRLISPPGGSLIPTSPKSRQIMLIALIIGLLIPLMVLYLIEITNTKVRGRKDLESLTLPFLGEVPQYVSSEEKKKRKNLLKKVAFWEKPADKSSIVVKEGKRDVVNEAFRVLRTNIEFMTRDKEGAEVMILTSYNPGSGKTFLCMNTAEALAIKGQKVLCIDGDLRHASLSQFVDSPKKGLSDYLAGRLDDLDSLLVRADAKHHLDILPVGTIPPNPSELIGDPRFRKAVDHLKGRYDYVFIDCPPLDIVADTQIIQDVADRTIFVVRAKLLERSMLPDLQRIYDEKKYHNMCYVLNGTEAGDGRYAYRYGYRYGYHYGHYGSHYGYYHSEEED